MEKMEKMENKSKTQILRDNPYLVEKAIKAGVLVHTKPKNTNEDFSKYIPTKLLYEPYSEKKIKLLD